FQTHQQVLTALGERVGLLPQRRGVDVQDFSPPQIRAHLVKRHHRDKQAADRQVELISGIHDLVGLATHPRMLRFLADLSVERLRAVADGVHSISAAGLYREVLGGWLSYEEQRTQGIRGAPVGLDLADLWRAVSTLALRLWSQDAPYLRAGELGEVAGT